MDIRTAEAVFLGLDENSLVQAAGER